MRILVCGGRDYDRYVHVYDTLTELQDERGPFDVVIAGRHPGEEPNGADYWAESWSFMERIPFYGFPARWGDLSHPDAVIRRRPDGSRYDAKAGPRRNQRMIDEGKPGLAVGFPRANGKWGPGTLDMLRRAAAAGIEVVRVAPGPTP
ncbi:SLOG family protein [Methylobacterium sp. Leaf108]|uniref:SLOG family protein n=1 Tax=Methylobacterium sp. Leaf108 TaxID=1736256 RepID=UPI0006F648DB|nr:SLOG family protein [Methylobacterium sp. Leaf108]KQP61041.1 hypothetical protein ASF39_15305 [Methylobacterium sp. Leaf108]